MNRRHFMALAGMASAAAVVRTGDPLAASPLRIGVTLHPYYSWVANVVGEEAVVVPVLPPGADPHTFQPGPGDLERLTSLDAVVINGLGHDAFMAAMLEASGSEPVIIQASEGVPPIVEAGVTNSHTFLSITSAAQQVGHIAAVLSALDPERADLFRRQARGYRGRLRGLLAEGLAGLETLDTRGVRIAVVHDGYDYLFQELGLEIDAVVQPRHGIDPSPKQLADTVAQLEAAGTDVLFAEAAYTGRVVDVIRNATGVRIYRLSHVYGGDYEAATFETEMARNVKTIVEALREASGA